MQEVQRDILSWDYHSMLQDTPARALKGLGMKRVPVQFGSLQEYCRVFRVLLLEELKAHLLQVCVSVALQYPHCPASLVRHPDMSLRTRTKFFHDAVPSLVLNVPSSSEGLKCRSSATWSASLRPRSCPRYQRVFMPAGGVRCLRACGS